LGSEHSGVPVRGHTSPVAQVEVVMLVQPLLPTVQARRVVLDGQLAPLPTVQALVQHVADPAGPEQAPLVQVAATVL
jgi:hypothetical protein